MPVITAGPVMNSGGGLANAKANGALKRLKKKKKCESMISERLINRSQRENQIKVLTIQNSVLFMNRDGPRIVLSFFFLSACPHSPSHRTTPLRPPVQSLAVNHLITDVKFSQMECG